MDIICELDAESKAQKYPDFNRDDIQKIRTWLEKSPHLPKITDHEIFSFLHSTRFSVETTKTKIDNFYTCRTHMKQYFECRDPDTDDMNFVYETVCHMILPKRTPEDYGIIYMKMFDPSNFNFKTYIKFSNYTAEVEILSHVDGLAEGYIFLIDMIGGSLAHLAQVNLSDLKKMLFYMTEAYPVRIKGVHFINAPFPMLMDKVLSMIRPLIPSDLANEVYVHDNVDSLTKHIPLDCLPNDYEGGKLKSALELSRDYRAYILKNRNYFIEESKYRRVDEKLRPAKMKSNMEIFGVEGNFKKLDFD